MKKIPHVIYWETGDKAIVPYFGNDESRYNTMVEVEIVKDDLCNCREWPAGTTGLLLVRLYDSVDNEDENGNPRDYFERSFWSNMLNEV